MASSQSRLPAGGLLACLFLAGAAWAAYALARHPGFQPSYVLRSAAPVLALAGGAAFTHQVARQRARRDIAGEFDPGGRALFLGVVMVAVTLLAWLLVSQAAPACWGAAFGSPRSEAGEVVERIGLVADPDCRTRLEVRSASITRPMDECVAESIWRGAAPGTRLTLDLLTSALGAEIVGIRP